MEKEIWKDVVGYDGYYEVSNLGNVRSVDHEIMSSNGKLQFRKGKLLNGWVDHKGYYKVHLSKGSKKEQMFVHRLVALAFLPNPNNYPIINHKDENPLNNRVENLEWCTYSYNINYGTANERQSNSMIGKNINSPSLSKSVIQYTLDDEFVNEYLSSHEASRQTGICRTNISKCCRGGCKSAGGYKWCFKSE